MNWLEFWIEAAVTVYTLALLLLGIGLFLKVRKGFLQWGGRLLGIGLCLTSLAIFHRAFIAKRIPGINFYESLVLFSWSVSLMAWIFCRRVRGSAVAILAGITVLIPLAYALWFDSGIEPLTPVLQSGWRDIHIGLSFLGQGAFLIAGFTAIVYLFFPRRIALEEEGRDSLEAIRRRAVGVGFLLFTGGILSGSLWANQAWGSYYSWDPMENWTLVTWIVYAIEIQLRVIKGWSGPRLAWVSLVGLGCLLFNYWIFAEL